jgi:hypothetical protein
VLRENHKKFENQQVFKRIVHARKDGTSKLEAPSAVTIVRRMNEPQRRSGRGGEGINIKMIINFWWRSCNMELSAGFVISVNTI